MTRLFTIGYGALCYAVFLVALLYAIGFVGGVVVPRTIDHGVAASVGEALVVNVLLLALFAVQHSVMARPAFKLWWTRWVPTTVERSTYVLLSSLVLLLLFWQWRSMPRVLWDVAWLPGRITLWVVFAAGWATVLVSTFLINHFDLFGLRQVYLAWRGKPYCDLEFHESLLYRVVRHPLLLGFIIAFWAAPTMTASHLLFAVVTTAYMLIPIQLEERDLNAVLGDRYRDYRGRVPMLVPGLRRPGNSRAGGPMPDPDRGPEGVHP